VEKVQNKLIYVDLKNEIRSPKEVVEKIASIKGSVDLYCFYEGADLKKKSIPLVSAVFYRDNIFKPLLEKKEDVKLWPYSLKGWYFQKNAEALCVSTPLGESINKINPLFVECIYASSFFRYCTMPKEALRKLFNEKLKDKEWLFELSKNSRKNKKTIEEFFGSKFSVFESINGMQVNKAYSVMQYVEGYYLVRESVKRGLSNNKKKIEIAFVLQNDEYKYYKDFPEDIETMLKTDFGREIEDVVINVTFQFFREGELVSRLYLDKNEQVEAGAIDSYFEFLKNK